MGTQLPHQTPLIIQSHPSTKVRNAYSIVQTFEAQEYNLNTKARKETVINLRIVAYLMLYAPSDTARVHIANRVLSRQDQESIAALGNLYSVCLIRPFRKSSGRTPHHTPITSRPSYANIHELTQRLSIQAPQNHAQAKSSALARDCFRCQVSDTYDPSVMRVVNWEEFVDPQAAILYTECAHIFPESINTNIPGNPAKVAQAASIWTILEAFGYENVFEELDGSNIHRLENVMTFSKDVHDLFNRLDIWFQPTGTPNTYDICSANNRVFSPRWNRRITFTSSNPQAPVPSPTYLAIHAACARVAHMSGATEYMDQSVRDLESLTVLSGDGTSAELLEYALQPFSQQIEDL